MSVPLLASARMHFMYTIAGLQHVMNLYCAAVEVSGVYNVGLNAGGNITVQQAADAVGSGMCPMLTAADCTSFTATLQTLTGGVWFPRSTVVVAGTLAASGTTIKGGQVSLVLRDISNHLMKVILLESQAPVGFRTTSPAGLSTAASNFYKLFSVTSGTVTNRPALWAVSRGDNALFAEPMVGFTTDLNDKVRRARGLV